ncbi:MAG: hypothetical protein ACOCR0_03465 [Haloferacaceae archaeon]
MSAETVQQELPRLERQPDYPEDIDEDTAAEHAEWWVISQTTTARNCQHLPAPGSARSDPKTACKTSFDRPPKDVDLETYRGPWVDVCGRCLERVREESDTDV